jgi:hypothetical protein
LGCSLFAAYQLSKIFALISSANPVVSPPKTF